MDRMGRPTIQPVTIDIMLNNNQPFNVHLNLVCFSRWFASTEPCLLPPSNEVWGRIIFSQVSVTLSIGVGVDFRAGPMTRGSASRGSPSKGGLHPEGGQTPSALSTGGGQGLDR